MIRGTAVTLHQRETRIPLQRARFNGGYALTLPQRSSRNRATNPIHALSRQTQDLRVSSSRSINLLELEEVLNSWHDPEDGANELDAKERILNSFKEFSNQLDLSFLDLSTLPNVIGRMHNLEFINISNNRFCEIPLILTELPHLRLLNISNNILREIPNTIKQFKNLEILNVACNQLRKVSSELARLPMIQNVILSHNRILDLPENLDTIRNLEVDDQVALASFDKFSLEFATQWETTFQYEAGAACFEIWLARYEQILNLPEAARYSKAFQCRIGMLLDAMINKPDLRTLCYEYAQSVIATCHDGILFSLFEMEIKLVEEKMIADELSEDEVCKEMERAFNFYRLQELAILHSERQSELEDRAPDEDRQADTLETALFFYISPANTLEMPLGGDRIRFMRYPNLSNATDDDVRQAVEQIRAEKTQLGLDFLINFVSEKEFWINYLKSHYPETIAEQTQIFMNQMDELEDRKSKMNEYDYLKEIEALVKEKNKYEKLLYRQLTKNIVIR